MFKNRERRAAGSQQGDQLYVSTGQTARDADRKYIKDTTTFTPDTADGTTEVVFTFNAEGMEETDLVVFEEIFYQGDLYERKSVAEHSDLMDEEQSVSIPKIKTDMSDAKTGLKIANAEEDMVLYDTVRYSGLVIYAPSIFPKILILNNII
jgi:hypothetical protein